jgi:hypothetical protein
LSLAKVALLLYAVSLVLPAFSCAAYGDSTTIDTLLSTWFGLSGSGPTGINVLLNGWLGIFTLEPRWYINLLFFYLLMSESPKNLMAPIVATIAALTCIVIPAQVCGNSFSYSVSLASGGYLWVAAITVAAIAYRNKLLDRSRSNHRDARRAE